MAGALRLVREIRKIRRRIPREMPMGMLVGRRRSAHRDAYGAIGTPRGMLIGRVRDGDVYSDACSRYL